MTFTVSVPRSMQKCYADIGEFKLNKVADEHVKNGGVWYWRYIGGNFSSYFWSVSQNGVWLYGQNRIGSIQSKGLIGGSKNILNANNLSKRTNSCKFRRCLVTQWAHQTTISWLDRSFAGILKQNGVNIGQNRLFKWLREHGFLVATGKRYNTPTQHALDLGIMAIRESVVTTHHGSVNRFTPLITGKGQQYFANKFLKKSVKEVSKWIWWWWY